jgi:hypothetical protein
VDHVFTSAQLSLRVNDHGALLSQIITDDLARGDSILGHAVTLRRVGNVYV